MNSQHNHPHTPTTTILTVVIPRLSLQKYSNNPHEPPTKQIKPTKSLVQALTNNVIFLKFKAKPVLKGDLLIITIPEDEYIVGVNAFKNNLHGTIVWPIGYMPSTVAFNNKLAPFWKDM